MADDDDNEVGEPVVELRDLAIETRRGFAQRVRSRIERRETSNELLGLFWHLPTAVLLAFIEIAFGLFGSGNDNGGETK